MEKIRYTYSEAPIISNELKPIIMEKSKKKTEDLKK